MPANASISKHPNLDDWLSIGTDGRVTVRSGKVDIGQRISTAVALLVAEEFDIEMNRIDVVRAETGLSPDEGVTSGSNSMIGIGGRLAAPPLPHHRAYGSVPRRFDRVNLERRHGVGGDRVSRKSGCAAPVGPPGDWTCARNPSANRRRPPH